MPFVKILVEDQALTVTLQAVAKAMGDPKPPLRAIGEYLRESTQLRIRAEGPGPNGEAWPDLSPAYLLVKKGPGKLRESGQLLATLTWQLVGESGVAIGSNKVYAAIQQFGGQTKPHRIVAVNKKALFWPGAAHPVKAVNHPGSKIPARPYLGVSQADRTVLLLKLRSYLAAAAGKAPS